ncbi:MAG: hypothetical protein ACTSXY_02855 [Promethearchaeota archaeon]
MLEFKLDLKQNAFHSIFQALKHIEQSYLHENDGNAGVEFDHDEQMTSYKRNGKEYFYIDDFYYEPPGYYQLKFAILLLIQSIELLVLEIVKSNNTEDIFLNKEKQITINFYTAINKIKEINPKILTEEQTKRLIIYKKIRNKLEHFEIQSDFKSLYKIVVNLFSIIDTIFQIHFKINLYDFYSFDCWKNDFDEKYSDIIKNILSDSYKMKPMINPKVVNKWITDNPEDKLTFCICCNQVSYSLKADRCLYCKNRFDKSTLDMIEKIYFSEL